MRNLDQGRVVTAYDAAYGPNAYGSLSSRTRERVLDFAESVRKIVMDAETGPEIEFADVRLGDMVRVTFMDGFYLVGEVTVLVSDGFDVGEMCVRWRNSVMTIQLLHREVNTPPAVRGAVINVWQVWGRGEFKEAVTGVCNGEAYILYGGDFNGSVYELDEILKWEEVKA